VPLQQNIVFLCILWLLLASELQALTYIKFCFNTKKPASETYECFEKPFMMMLQIEHKPSNSI